MRRLSSPLTSVYKRVLPLLWLLALVAFAGHAVWRTPQALTGTLLLAAVVAAAGVIVFDRRIRPLADEVWLDGDDLLMRRGSARARIPLREVATARYVATGQPHIVVTLHGGSPSRPALSFLPLATGGMFRRVAPHPIARELTERAHAAGAALA